MVNLTTTKEVAIWYEYDYDAAGRVTSCESYFEGLMGYQYDNTDQLTGLDYISP